MNWLDIAEQIKYCAHVKTFQYLNPKDKNELAHLIKVNVNNNRLQTDKKLHNKPRSLMKSKKSRSTLHNRCYNYNTLPRYVTLSTNLDKFKKNLKIHMNIT